MRATNAAVILRHFARLREMSLLLTGQYLLITSHTSSDFAQSIAMPSVSGCRQISIARAGEPQRPAPGNQPNKS